MGKKRNLKAMPEVQVALPSEGLPSVDELEALLSEESDEEFGLVQASEDKKAILKEWSAQDFANIYTRFRPHLERHARKFLRNQSQVDEVVQDAFLYLMVTLPELDSEIGVLRFLKWKVRLLCLDVIRASGRAYINSIDDVAEPESSDPEVGAELEHAEDAAIVRLALSKLNPRHREVLIASMYEEKSTREVAAQVGLSENATLQLIFRARAAFKKALLGADVDTEGMSVSAILSVAARKAAEEAKKVGAQAMVFVLFLILAVGAFVNIGGRGQTSTLAEEDRNPVSSTPDSSATGNPVVKPSPDQPVKAAVDSGNTASTVAFVRSTPVPSASPYSEASLKAIYAADPTVAGAVKAASLSSAVDVYDFYDSVGSHARIEISPSSLEVVKRASFDFTLEGVIYTSILVNQRITDLINADGTETIVITGEVASPFDSTGKVWGSSSLVGSQVYLEIRLSATHDSVIDTKFAVSAPKK
jgi:RNA polymerase sigma-70 factor (ECF subfamily)